MTSAYSVSGVIPALVTPINKDGSLNEWALARLIDRVVVAGVTAISVLGSTGEGPLLPAALRRRIVDAAVRLSDGRVPVVAGWIGGALDDAAAEARGHARSGAACILASPPSYFLLDQAAILAYYGELASRVTAPLIVYHFPALTKVVLEPETVAQLATIDGIIGLKDSSGDESFLAQAAAAVAGKPFALLAGSGRLASVAARLGARAMLVASGNVIPGQLVELWAALQDGRTEAAARLQSFVSSVEAACREHPYPMSWKAAVRLTGIDCGRPIPPLQELSAERSEALRRAFVDLAVIARSEPRLRVS